MTLEEILPHTKQKLGALKTMLSRKVDERLIMRTSRGKYTYIGNPLYSKEDVPSVPSVPSVSSMSNVANNESYSDTPDVTFKSAIKSNLEAASQESYKVTSNDFMEFDI